MARGRRKKTVVKKDATSNRYSFRTRRSSMRVNLSYISNISESENSSLKKSNKDAVEEVLEESSLPSDSLNTVNKCVTNRHIENDTTATPASVTNVTVINNGNCDLLDCSKELDTTQNNSLQIIKEKEQQLNRTCMRLKNAIMNKTQALFDKENELAIRTTEILAAQCSPCFNQTTEVCQESDNDKRSPSIRIDIGKNSQIIMSGDGRKRNPVQVLIHKSPERENAEHSEDSDEVDMDRSQSIASTPKKSRLENDKEPGESSDTLLRIPVARLFDNELNNAVSEINNLVNNNINSPKRTDVNNDNANNLNNTSETLNKLNYPVSPILSQGTRRSRLSRLSLKKKSTKKAEESSALSTCTSNESFISKLPITCSSFIEQDKTNNKDVVSKNCTIINLDEKSSSRVNCVTINLEANENSKTINIDNSTTVKSYMEITTISSRMPIIRRSFQNLIRKSLKLENIPFVDENSKNLNTTQKKKVPSADQSKKSSLNNQDCSANTVRTSLNVNTSLDQINSAESIMQKENQTPNNLNEVSNKSNETDEDEVVIQRQSTCTVRTSMQVNTSLDSIRKSIVSIPTATLEQNKIHKIVSKTSNTDTNKETDNSGKTSEPLSNQEKDYSSGLTSRQPSTTSTIRSSLQVNTSLDSARKSSISKNLLDYNKILSMVEENTHKEHESGTSEHNSINESSDNVNELEDMSLMERIKNSANKRSKTCEKSNESVMNRKRKSKEIQDSIYKSFRKSTRVKNAKKSLNRNSEVSASTSLDKSRKSTNSNNNSTTNEASVIGATPYPISRSVLMKTMIKNSIAMNTLDPRKLIDLSSDDSTSGCEPIIKRPTNSTSKKHKNLQNKEKLRNQSLSDTVVLSSTDEVSSDSETEKEPVIIEESLNESDKSKTKTEDNSIEELKNKKGALKRKLYPLRENSQLVSFSPSDVHESFKKSETTVAKVKRKRKQIKKRKEESKVITKSSEPAFERESIEENEITPEKVKPVKKKKKITSKKIVVKKVRDISLIDNIMQNDEEIPQRLSDRNSLREFDLRRLEQRKENSRKNSKIIIVLTGLSKEEKNSVKSVIKTLGSATLEMNVTSRTTHVISSGIRTINLLKGIIRGCWLLSMDWALQSLECEKWLDPTPYEMCHFSKAVQENRRDRQLFGKAYVPELFVTCGFIYIENGTSPSTSVLKELVKIAGGRITEDPTRAEIVIGVEGLKEIWILDSITTGEIQPIVQYKRN